MITTAPTVITSRLDVPPPPAGCLDTPNAFRAWLNLSAVISTATGVLFGYTAGPIAEAVPEDRDKPRFVFDAQDRFLGLATWMPDLQGWTIGGQVGQLMTLIRSADTVIADLAARPMAGWVLCDGGTAGVSDLRPSSGENSFFKGTAPEWTVYTVAFAG